MYYYCELHDRKKYLSCLWNGGNTKHEQTRPFKKFNEIYFSFFLDRIVPRSWMYPVYQMQWQSLLRMDQGIDKGPQAMTEDEFNEVCLRCGRTLNTAGLALKSSLFSLFTTCLLKPDLNACSINLCSLFGGSLLNVECLSGLS